MIGNYIAIWILILSIFFTAKLWIWLYKNAFWIEVNKKIIFISLFIWGIAAGSILLFPQIMNHFNIDNFTNWDYSFKTLFIFIFYLNSLIFILWIITKSLWKKQVLNLLVFNIFFIILFYIFKKINLDIEILNILLYYLFVAYGEEFIKSQLWFLITDKVWEIKSDLLLYHILVAIWFAFWENIVYLMWAISFSTFITVLSWWLWIVLLRWVLWFWAHTFYSSIIWMWNILWSFMVLLWILIAMLIHSWYDLSLYYDYKIIIPLFIVIMYIWVSYIFYKIDRIYVE